MPARAIIIAIEDYPNSTTLARQLPGTNAGAADFRKWLIDRKHLDPQSILACAEPTCAWRTGGTTHDEIVAELMKLATRWKDENNDELYFYFSGHGFSYDADLDKIQIDVLVGSDFVDEQSSGDCCLKFQEVHKKLWTALGPGNHYYFIDACRNPISLDQIEVPIMGKKFPVSARGNSKYYTLYSTALGQTAKVESGFTQILVNGLNGAGTAKRWDKTELYVTFEGLRGYLKAKLRNQEIEAIIGADEPGRIVKIDPVPEYPCDISVTDALADDNFTLKVSHSLLGDRAYPFTGTSLRIQLKPFDYNFEVTHATAPVVQIEPAEGSVSLYDPAIARFRKLRTTRSHRSVTDSDMPNLVLKAAPFTEVRLVNESGESIGGMGDLAVRVPPGRYVAEVLEDGMSIERSEITVTSGGPLVVDLLERPQNKLRDRILQSFSHAGTPRYTAFSEQLGNIANWDLGLWLSIFGASHILNDPTRFSLLQNLGLDRFQDLHPGDSPVYVLFGSEKSVPFKVALSEGPQVIWEDARTVDALVGICEKRFDVKPGLHVLSLRIAEQPPISLAVYCLPNRVTFVALAEDTSGRLRVHQYVLPVHTLFPYLDPVVWQYFNFQPLSVVRTIALAQTRFAQNQKLTPVPNSPEERDWQALTYGKWLDPLMSLIACYEIVRSGRVDSQRDLLTTVVGNLRKYFPGIPDTEVIARIIHLEPGVAEESPLLSDGVLLLDDAERLLRLPAARLDYASPWTMWRGAVNTT